MAAELTDQPVPAEARLTPRGPDDAPSAAARSRRFRRSLPDARLAQRIRGGDEGAFEVLFDRYHRPLLSFCRHMLGSREEAEDAVQHVFVSAHRHLVAGTRVADVRPWLYASARNRCVSVLRARREALALDDVPAAIGAGLAVAQEVERRQDLRDVLADLAELPDDQRAALVLSELGALSHDQIAGVLEVRRDKVKALVFQARETLAGRRQAREADCSAIREQLANLRGAALRRAPLRRHLELCDGCRSFRDEVRHQREAMALLLPVVPTIALKAKVVGAAAAGGAALPAAGATVSAGLAAKALAVAAIAGSAGGGYTLVREQAASERPRPVTEVVVPPELPVAAEAPEVTDASMPAPSRSAADERPRGAAKRQPARAKDSNRPAAAADDKTPAPVARGRDGVPGPPAHSKGRGKGKGRAKGKGESNGAFVIAPRGRPAEPGRESAPGQAKKAEDPPAPAKTAKPVKPVKTAKPVKPVGAEKTLPAMGQSAPTPPAGRGGQAKKGTDPIV